MSVGHSAGPKESQYPVFVHTHTRELLQLAFLLTRHRQDSEDLVQDTLLQVYRHWSKVQGARSESAYVRRILTNLYLARLRRNGVVEAVQPLDTNVSVSSPQDPLVALPEQDAMIRGLASLSPREQIALVLRYYEDLDDETIASILRCPRSTVRSLVRRGLRKLREDPNVFVDETAQRRNDV